jgi:hypothetical protein
VSGDLKNGKLWRSKYRKGAKEIALAAILARLKPRPDTEPDRQDSSSAA